MTMVRTPSAPPPSRAWQGRRFGVFSHYEEAKSRQVCLQDATLTQRKLLKIAQKITGTTNDQWEITVTKAAPLEAAAYGELKKEFPNGAIWAMSFITRAVYAEGYGARFTKVGNEKLDLKQMTDDRTRGYSGWNCC